METAMNWSPYLDLAKLASVGLFSGLFSAFIATRDHRFKKWWELKVAVYQTLIDALSDLAYSYDSKYSAELRSNELSPETEDELRRITLSARVKVRKAADSGKFLLSEDVLKALAELAEYEAKTYSSNFEDLDTCLWATRNCLNRIVELSLKDLRLNRHFLLWKLA